MISIPDPCNEDFTKMTPTERGNFCSKCQIDTFDFRDLSTTDINKLILQNKGQHLCGQFKSSQLDHMNQGFVNWKNQKKQTFRSKFVLALVMVFGLTLFSCNSQEEKTIVEIQSMELFANPVDKVAYVNALLDEHELDLIDFVTEIEEVTCEIPLPGMMVMDDIIAPEVFLEGEITAGVPVPEVAGGMVASNYWDYLEDTVEVPTEDPISPNLVEVIPSYFEAMAFPNPTAADATLALEILETGQFDINLYDMSGRLLRAIYSGELVEGRQNFQVELANENSGMYIVRVVSNDQNESVKIQKLN